MKAYSSLYCNSHLKTYKLIEYTTITIMLKDMKNWTARCFKHCDNEKK